MTGPASAGHDEEGHIDLERFSLLNLERRLSLIPWLATIAIWIVLAAVLLLLRYLQPDPEMGQVVAWMLPGSFLVVVPGLGGFVCLLLRLRRARTDISLLHDLHERLGGSVVSGSLLRPLIRPRLLALVGDYPVEVLLSPPIPRTRRPLIVDPQRAAAEAVTAAAAEALETPEALLGTGTWPQLEVRIGIDHPFQLHLSTSPHLGRITSQLSDVHVAHSTGAGQARILSDEPAQAAALLADRNLHTTLIDITRFNAPWATRLILRPAAAGRGAGAYLLSVAGNETSAERLAKAIRSLVEAPFASSHSSGVANQ